MESVSNAVPVWQVRLRRTLFFGLTLLTSAGATGLLLNVLEANDVTAIEVVGLVLFFALFTWIAGALWTAIAGFGVELAGRDPAGIDVHELAGRPLRTRTAVVMPIYNEDPVRVGAGLTAIWSSLGRESEERAFDLFILSDTSDAHIAAEEEALWQGLSARWGANYECMIVLDADSVMSGHALVTLARAMEAHPQIGILQSLPLPAGRETLFGRLIQFGSRLQSPMLSAGLAYWQVGESNYWGHNAAVRLRPFAQYCTLPRLSGRPPLGGDILSHDFVEAAFMRRAGYEVRQLPDLSGSWEEVPANVLDYAARDRRWTQGNLQHSRVLVFRGLHPLGRVHFLTGIVAYASSPMWLALLLLSSVLSAIEAAKKPAYFSPGLQSLFPQWPQIRSGEIGVLLGLTVVVLLLPKVLGACLAIRDRVLRQEFGGSARLWASLLVVQLFCMVLAPTMMLFHSTLFSDPVAGRSVSWNAQERTERGVTLREAFRRQKWHLALGVLWGAAMLRLAPQFFWWLTPVLVGLLFGIPLTMWTSRVSAGRLFRRRGLLLTPEETAPPPELVILSEASADIMRLVSASGSAAPPPVPPVPPQVPPPVRP